MTTFNLIRQWAADRNLIYGSSPFRQREKLKEELNELDAAMINYKRNEIIDSLGDIIVVLTIMAKQYDLDIEDCIDVAYREIKDRKGRMVNGIFVKDL